MRPTILITGAAGGVAGLLVQGLCDAYELRLTDRTPRPGLVVGDLLDPAFCRDACSGVDAIVHLAAEPDPGQPWRRLRGCNTDVVVNVLDAAAAERHPLVIIASSLHAVGGHVDAGVKTVSEDASPYPCCSYGATKVLAEAMARVYSSQWDLRVLCLRLGGVASRPAARSWLPGWLSPADLPRLVTAALTADVHYGVYHGTSANTPAVWDLGRARAELGYEPQDDSAVHAATVPDDLSAESHPARLPRWGLLHRS